MDEHRIRLRGGWTCRRGSSASDAPELIALPLHWDPAAPRRLRLTRRFGRPAIDARRQGLFLELDRAPGIQSLLLNGKTLTPTSPARSYYLIELAEIEQRNTIVIEVDIGESSGGASSCADDWGQIALLIRPIAGISAG